MGRCLIPVHLTSRAGLRPLADGGVQFHQGRVRIPMSANAAGKSPQRRTPRIAGSPRCNPMTIARSLGRVCQLDRDERVDSVMFCVDFRLRRFALL